jgi:hypothetical protein
LQLEGFLKVRIVLTSLLGVALIVSIFGGQASAQDARDRTVEQYECKDVMRDSGGNRDVAIAFLHGFILGRSGGSKFNLDALQRETDAFLDRCLMNPTNKALDVMMTVKK